MQSNHYIEIRKGKREKVNWFCVFLGSRLIEKSKELAQFRDEKDAVLYAKKKVNQYVGTELFKIL